MKKVKTLITIVALAVCVASGMSACGNSSSVIVEPISSDSLYVVKVENLPEDYEMVTLNGEEYYKVDDTVYRVTISEGKPYFEVLGQLYA